MRRSRRSCTALMLTMRFQRRFTTEGMMTSKQARDGSTGSGLLSRHPLALAGEIRRRAIINREPVASVAKKLKLDYLPTRGLCRLLGSITFMPTSERLALIAQRDRGLDDADIGEIFGRDAAWSAEVRRNAAALRKAEPISASLELYDQEIRPDDPSPEEIATQARALQTFEGVEPSRLPGIRQYHWRYRTHAFVQGSVE